MNYLEWPYCSGGAEGKGHDETCSVNFKYGMKRDFNAWLETLGPSAPVKTLTELRRWNLAHEKAGAIKFGPIARSTFRTKMDLAGDRARNDADVRKDNLLASRTNGLDAVLKANQLDAILTPGANGARSRRARRVSDHRGAVRHGSGTRLRSGTVSEGFRRATRTFCASASPARRAANFTAVREISYAFEQATKRRVAPKSTP